MVVGGLEIYVFIVGKTLWGYGPGKAFQTVFTGTFTWLNNSTQNAKIVCVCVPDGSSPELYFKLQPLFLPTPCFKMGVLKDHFLFFET